MDYYILKPLRRSAPAPPKGEPRRSINRRNRLPSPSVIQRSEATWESVLLTPHLDFAQSQGDADSHDQFENWSRNDSGSGEPPRRFQHHPSPRRALPLLGEVPSAHTGERGLRGRTRCRREKTGRSADNSFPYWHSRCPLSLACARQLPRRGAKGVDLTRRTVSGIIRFLRALKPFIQCL